MNLEDHGKIIYLIYCRDIVAIIWLSAVVIIQNLSGFCILNIVAPRSVQNQSDVQ